MFPHRPFSTRAPALSLRARSLLALALSASLALSAHAQTVGGSFDAASPTSARPAPATQGGTSGGAGSSGGGTDAAGGDGKVATPVDPPAVPGTTGAAAGAPVIDLPRPKDTPRAPAAEIDDPSSWERWWLYNREPLIDLRDHVYGAPVTGDDALARGGAATASAVGADTLLQRVQPALVFLIEREPNTEILVQALIALARAGAPDAGIARSKRAELLTRHLSHPQPQVAEAAALALGILGESAAVPDLCELARDSRAGRELVARGSVPFRIRAYAAYATGLVAQRANNEDVRRFAVRGLFDLLDDRGLPRDVQVAVVSALGISRLGSVPATWRVSAVRTAKELPAAASRETLIAHLTLAYTNERVNAVARAHTLTALGRLALGASPLARATVEDLCLAALEPSAHAPNELVQSAALALGALSDAGDDPRAKAARIGLMNAAHQADLDTRHFALLALGQIGARPGADANAPFAGTADIHRFLVREVDDGRGAMRHYAALGLGILGEGLRGHGRTPSPEASRALLRRLDRSSAPEEAAACALSLALRGDTESSSAISARLAQANDDLTRAGCAVALGLLGVDRSLPALRRLLLTASARPALLREAAIGLALLRDPALSQDLCAQLALAAGAGPQTSLLNALAYVGDARSLDTLLTWTADTRSSAGVRARAVAALGAVCDGRALPWNESLTQGVNYRAEVETLTDPNGGGVIDLR